MTSRLLWLIWYGPEFLHLKFSVLYDQISDNVTNILSEIWSTYYPSMEEFDTCAGQIRDFLRKNLVQRNITEFFCT